MTTAFSPMSVPECPHKKKIIYGNYNSHYYYNTITIPGRDSNSNKISSIDDNNSNNNDNKNNKYNINNNNNNVGENHVSICKIESNLSITDTFGSSNYCRL